MCGIAGYVLSDPSARADVHAAGRMIRVLRHRGPDDEGVWAGGQAALANRRLAVIDLSPRGHQPMQNEEGFLHIAFNGEIYNFRELRRDLESRGHRLQSDTDTEVILHLFEEHGPDCLSRLRGMFAFAIWNARDRSLFIARDRLGKKPLFYFHDDHQLVFGSEPKALLQHPAVPASPDPEAVHHYLTYGYVPSPWSAFRGLHKLPPGHYLLLKDGRAVIERYWELHYRPKRRGSEPELAEEATVLLEEATRLRLISDVPVGALLSGGLDSATVVALMRRVADGPVRTFSIGFEQAEYDELGYARAVAERCGTEHHELVVRPDAVEILPRLVWHYNEPFADSSAIPSFAVSELARRHVTVAINGDGGDESFLGYERYLGVGAASLVDRIPFANRIAAAAASLLPLSSPKRGLYRVRRFAETLAADPIARYGAWIRCFSNGEKAELYSPGFQAQNAGLDSIDILRAAFERSDALDEIEATAHADIQLYLPDDLLVKMDIASMAHSLEMRSPFLDHRVVEFAAALPRRMKLRGLVQKRLLRTMMRGVLPPSVLKRKKMGFGVPIDHWLRRELRDMARDVLLDSRAIGRGYFRREVVRRYLDEHAEQRGHHHFRLWALLMLELWHRSFIDQRCAVEPPVSVSHAGEPLHAAHST